MPEHKDEHANQRARAEAARAEEQQRQGQDTPQTRAGVVSPFSADQVATPPASPPLLGGRQVAVLMGPYRGSVLTMPDAEAQQAIDDHWAADPPLPPFDASVDRDHPPLTDAERQAAEQAAQAWADAQQAQAEQQSDQQGEGGAHRREETRAMQADHDPDRLTYPTRDHKPRR